MRSTLFYIPLEFAGWPVFGFGLLLAAWVMASVGMLIWLVRRQGLNADTWGYVPLLALVGAIIVWVLPELCKPEGLPIRGFGMMNMLGVVAGVWLAAWRAKRRGWDPDLIYSLAFWMLVPGILGARAFYVIEYWREYQTAYTDPQGGLAAFIKAVVNLTEGGLVVYGAFLGAVAGVLLFVRKHRVPLLAMCDLIAPSMMLGLALGRVGCLMNGCCFGGVCDHAWAVTFPAESPAWREQVRRGQLYGFALDRDLAARPRIESIRPDSLADRAGLQSGDLLTSINGNRVPTVDAAATVLQYAFYHRQPLHLEMEQREQITVPPLEPPERSLPVHPTQIYSVFDALAIGLLLLVFARFQRRDGEVFALLMSTYPISRFCIEGLRSDEAPIFGTGMSISQNVSLALLLCAVAFWTYLLRQPKNLSLPASAKGEGRRANC